MIPLPNDLFVFVTAGEAGGLSVARALPAAPRWFIVDAWVLSKFCLNAAHVTVSLSPRPERRESVWLLSAVPVPPLINGFFSVLSSDLYLSEKMTVLLSSVLGMSSPNAS